MINMDNMNTNQMNRNESAIKFIYPAFIMMAVQLLVQLFAGQLMFFYKGYKYTEGTIEEFMSGYMASLSSDKFTLLVSALSTAILAIVFLLWYRSEIIHVANVSLRQKIKIRGRLGFCIVPGILCISVGAGVFATFTTYFISLVKPDLVVGSVDIVSVIRSSEPGMMNILFIIYFVILSPICQELVFRGLTLGFAERRMTFMAANFVQAILCGFFTMDVIQMIYSFLFSLVLGYVYFRTENILIPILCNMLFCVTRLLFYDVTMLGDSLILFFIVFFLAMALVYLGIMLVKKSKLSFSEK